jgi:hypothetical protein
VHNCGGGDETTYDSSISGCLGLTRGCTWPCDLASAVLNAFEGDSLATLYFQGVSLPIGSNSGDSDVGQKEGNVRRRGCRGGLIPGTGRSLLNELGSSSRRRGAECPLLASRVVSQSRNGSAGLAGTEHVGGEGENGRRNGGRGIGGKMSEKRVEMINQESRQETRKAVYVSQLEIPLNQMLDQKLGRSRKRTTRDGRNNKEITNGEVE